ncbi:hypothetical protein THAR02_08761 [Trichoderma harzianum]|uniref:Uncharacterized protein n=1 Tax=Trichoderma harzianum TaxID=5544 RepID=A0A0F9XEQ6_TRIHA|nr:hypothetical protein THAR02_08761 [Trichoderma harzianum]
MAGFHIAQLMLRLLALSLHDSAHEGLSYDKWIWLSTWKTQKIENGQRVIHTRKGLGLSQVIERMETLWFEARHFYWPGGHIAIAELMQLYIPRSPLQARWSHQASIQAGSARSISPAYFNTLWMDEAKEASLAGDISLVTRLYERAITLAAEEVGRSYSQHLLAKLQFFWDRLRRAVKVLPLKLPRLEKISRDVMQPRGKILTAEVLLEVYQEAWNYYYPASSTTSLTESSPSLQPLPEAIPCWIGTKDVNTQKWSDFVFARLFVKGAESTWRNATFLALYRELRQMGQIDRKEPLGEALVQLHARELQEMAFKDTQRARTNSASTEASYITCTRKGPAMGTSKATTTGSTTKRKSNASAEKQETRTPSKVQTHGPPPPRNASRHYFLLRRDGHKRFQKFVEEADPYGPPTTTQD